MRSSQIGLFWCFCFIVPEAVLSVYFGNVFQRQDSFVVGGLVFLVTTIGAFTWTWWKAPGQFAIAWGNPRSLLGVNLSVAVSWIIYLIAVQMIEPVIAYTLFSGAIPLTTLVAARLGVGEASRAGSRMEALGSAIMALALVFLTVVSISGHSGFVRGGAAEAALGAALATGSGITITWMLFFSKRLDQAGLAPVSQFGFRFLLYLPLCLVGASLGIDSKGSGFTPELLTVLAIGVPLLAFPLFALQKAVATTTPLTIGAVGATGPFLVFILQYLEGRVDYSEPTLIGLFIYFAGALTAVWANARMGDRAAQGG